MELTDIKSLTEEQRQVQEARSSLVRVQEFRSSDLVQKEKFGQASFEEAVEPANRLISLFRQLPVSILDHIPNDELRTVRSQANAVYNLFQQILEFDINDGDVKNRQAHFIESLRNSFQSHFTEIYPLISYSVARTVDFNRLEEQGRAAVQGVRDQTQSLMNEIAQEQEEAARILEQVRKTAAERGVSQEAFYFKGEADLHRNAAGRWLKYTIAMSILVGLYGISTLFIHKIPLISPTNNYEMAQLIAGKLILFFILAYMLSICAKNFLSNRHNEIVNRHRQNALMTYKSLVDAGGTPEARDVILNHAAASVYQLHETGFTKAADGGGPSSSSIIGLLPKGSISSGS
jgi:hypothetical protein